MAYSESAFLGVADANGASEPALPQCAASAYSRPSLGAVSSESGLSTRSNFTDEGITSTGEHVKFRIKDFKSKIYNKSIVVQKDFEPKEGVQIAPDLVIHKFLAGGYQGGVYELADDAGNVRTDCLLKVLKKSAVLGDLEKEWAIGQALNVLANKNGYLVGFMKTYEALRVEGESGIRGMLIERLNGRLVEDVVSDHKFSDALYLRDLIYQMSLALFRAETVLGFKHADLRLTNIMEHHPDPNNPDVREFKIIDFGLASIQERVDSAVYKRLQKAVFSKLTDPEAFGKMFLKGINPANHFSALSEAIYKVAWIKHNDVYHILASLSHFTDDRTWAEEDREVVEQYADLMKDVTGIKLRLKFMPRAELDAKKAEKESEVQQLGYKVNHAFADLKHFGQRFSSQASVLNNSDIPPQDVLEHPLFTEHASSGLCVPYHNAECDDIALFSNMEMLRGRSRVLPEDMLLGVEEEDETEAGQEEEGSDDGAQQSWLKWKPLCKYVERSTPGSSTQQVAPSGAVERSSVRFSDGGISSMGGSANGTAPYASSSGVMPPAVASGSTAADVSGAPAAVEDKGGSRSDGSGRGGLGALASKLAAGLHIGKQVQEDDTTNGR